jgi:hypothetical protein
MYEPVYVNNGEPAFGISGTFRIGNVIYVRDAEADFSLLNHLADLGYEMFPYPENPSTPYERYSAVQRHRTTQEEIFGECLSDSAPGKFLLMPFAVTITSEYLNAPKHTLYEPDIHETIMSVLGAPARIDHHRPKETITERKISLMNAFVKNMVEVPYGEWVKFINRSQNYSGDDFVRALAHWAGSNSDKGIRLVRVDTQDSREFIDTSVPFTP